MSGRLKGMTLPPARATPVLEMHRTPCTVVAQPADVVLGATDAATAAAAVARPPATARSTPRPLRTHTVPARAASAMVAL